MAIRTSYSQNSTYIRCPKHWWWKYVEKLDADFEGASLSFGTAIDKAVMSMIQGNKDYLTVFNDSWFSTTTRKKEYKQIFDNPYIVFSHSDFDKDVLLAEDIEVMREWQQELKQTTSKDPIKQFNMLQNLKKNKFKKMSTDATRYFNRCSWLSLKRKGALLLELFEKDFLPKITKVHSVQKFYSVKDESTGDQIMGTLDFAVDLEGYDKPIIIDLKTAARPYTQEDIELSEQLPIYLALSKGKFSWETNLVGYVVLIKQISKNREGYCKNCGHKKTTRHNTCNATINGKRCGGEWEKKLELVPQMQVIIEEKTQEDVDKVLLDYGNIIDAMKRNIVYMDRSKCHNWFGSKCPYFKACHKGDLSGLKRRY